MSKRKRGSRFEQRQSDCYFCKKVGMHPIYETKKRTLAICNDCKNLLEVVMEVDNE
jgi:formylmethanofuran dehydrogenase subunit E